MVKKSQKFKIMSSEDVLSSGQVSEADILLFINTAIPPGCKHGIDTLKFIHCGLMIWRDRIGSDLAQVMDCCLTAPRHYLNQCWVIISRVPRHPRYHEKIWRSVKQDWKLLSKNCFQIYQVMALSWKMHNTISDAESYFINPYTMHLINMHTVLFLFCFVFFVLLLVVVI